MAPAAIEMIEGLEFRFYPGDKPEPPHVHVVFGEGKKGKKIKVKFWIGPPAMLVGMPPHRLAPRQLKRAREIIEERHDDILRKWNEYFGIR